MNQIIRLVKENKLTTFVIVIFVLMVIVFHQLFSLLVPNTGKPIYGNTEGKEEAKVDPSLYETLKTTLKEDKMVEEVEVIEGEKLITFIITVTADTTVDQAKSLAPKTLEGFSDVQKAFYNFQIFVKKVDEAQNNFPISAYKHPKSDGYSWTKDREIEVAE